MKPLLAILVFVGNLAFFGGSVVGALVLAIAVVVAISILTEIVSHARREAPRRRGAGGSGAKRAPAPRKKRGKPAITDGDIGPFVKAMLERGKHDAAIRCVKEHVPGSWAARRDLIALVEEHGRLQRSIRIANLAGVALPDEAAGFSAEQGDLIADRARRMAFIHLHDAMTARIEASITRLMAGAGPLLTQSAMLRADLAESTANPQWGAHEERELTRKLDRMSNTLRAMNSGLAPDPFTELALAENAAVLDADESSAKDEGFLLTPREREMLVLLARGMSSSAIAQALRISERTVTSHLSRLYAKLDVSTRAEAIALAMRTGLVSSPSERTLV